MPPLSDLPGEIKRPKLTKALTRLGFIINEVGGNGSHCKATWTRTQKAVTIPQSIQKHTLRYVLVEIEKCSGVTWEQIREAL